MCHYTYTLCICCHDSKEYDGICVDTMEYCGNRPVSADGHLDATDPRDCPSATGECLGESDFICEECNKDYLMEPDYDGLEEDGVPRDFFWSDSDEE